MAAAPSPAAEGKASPPPAAAPVPAPVREVAPIRIAKASLSNGTVNFSDYFVKPNYTVNVTRLSGRVTKFSSQADTVADLELHGSYGNAAPVDISAKLNPLAAGKAYLDLKGEIRGVDLTTLSTYAGKYAGYAIDKGKLSLYVSYKLADRQLSAENRIFLDPAHLRRQGGQPRRHRPAGEAGRGAPEERPRRDRHQPAHLRLSGRPAVFPGRHHRAGHRQSLRQGGHLALHLIASLFGGGEELSMIDFDPGRTALGAPAVKRLEALAKAMADRPALNLEITGRAATRKPSGTA